MGQFVGTAFGTPTISPFTQNLGGFSPYASQGFGMQAFPQQQYGQTFANPFIAGGYGASPYGIGQAQLSPVQQIAHLLQIVPQQLQQVQQLQQAQVQYLQQLLQWVPAQLQQLQQLVQLISHQGQQQGLPFGAGIAGPLTFGVSPQAYSGQSAGHVM